MQNLQTYNIVCDGKKIGFKVKLNSEPNFIQTKNKKDRLFTNFEFAKAIAYINGAKSGRDFSISLFIDGNTIPYKYIQRIGNNTYDFFATDQNGDNVRFIITETSITEYNNFGYICFDNGNNERTDKSFGIKRSKVLRKIIISSIEKLASKYRCVDSIMEFDKGITVKFTNTTACLDIMTNSGLMDFNQWRNEYKKQDVDPEYCRCFPFIKDMDKFVTFYSFVSKELYEPAKPSRSRVSIAIKFRSLLMEDLQKNWESYNRINSEKCKTTPEFVFIKYKKQNKILSTSMQ